MYTFALASLAVLLSRPAATASPTASPTTSTAAAFAAAPPPLPEFDLYQNAGGCVSQYLFHPPTGLFASDHFLGEHATQDSCFEACADMWGEDLHAARWTEQYGSGICTCHDTCDHWTTCRRGVAAVVKGKEVPELTACSEALAVLFEGFKHGLSKTLCIVASSSAILSLLASFLLVYILVRSCKGLRVTYHRLLLGMSCSDIFYSLSWATFGAVTPSEQNYWIWNARGSKASCDAFGVMGALGLFGGLFYMCSLNLFYLAQTKFSGTYIAKRIEPWLHLVPILMALSGGIIAVATDGIYANDGGVCSYIAIAPPHCEGYEDGEIPEGFEDPCRPGGLTLIFNLMGLFIILTPVVIGVSLVLIFVSVKGGCSRSPDGQELAHSHAVLYKAAAYTVGYFLTWSWFMIFGAVTGAGGVLPRFFFFFWWFFQPLQGLWTFLIYMHPRVLKARRSSERSTSWCCAFADALQSAVRGGGKDRDGANGTTGVTGTSTIPPLGVRGREGTDAGAGEDGAVRPEGGEARIGEIDVVSGSP